jgi:hypothetical protein
LQTTGEKQIAVTTSLNNACFTKGTVSKRLKKYKKRVCLLLFLFNFLSFPKALSESLLSILTISSKIASYPSCANNVFPAPFHLMTLVVKKLKQEAVATLDLIKAPGGMGRKHRAESRPAIPLEPCSNAAVFNVQQTMQLGTL